MAKEKKVSIKDTVRKFYKNIQKQKAELAAVNKGTYITDGLLTIGGTLINLKTCTQPLRLRGALAHLIDQHSSMKKANEILGTNLDIIIGGATLEEWTADIKLSFFKLELMERKIKLQQDEAKLKTMDPTLLRDIEMEEMASKYSDSEETEETVENKTPSQEA